jgi:hypothetical protein
MLQHSDQIDLVAGAIASAQSVIGGIVKDAKAEAGKRGTYRYVTIGAVLDEVRRPLADHGLALLQAPHLNHETGVVGVETRLVHTSGQWVACVSECQCAAGDPQSVGSGQTYMRRYGLMALLGLAAEDDDGQAARGAPTGQPPAPQVPVAPPKSQLDEYRTRLVARCAEKGIPAPVMEGWDVDRIKFVGVFLAKNGRLPSEDEVPFHHG